MIITSTAKLFLSSGNSIKTKPKSLFAAVSNVVTHGQVELRETVERFDTAQMAAHIVQTFRTLGEAQVNEVVYGDQWIRQRALTEEKIREFFMTQSGAQGPRGHGTLRLVVKTYAVHASVKVEFRTVHDATKSTMKIEANCVPSALRRMDHESEADYRHRVANLILPTPPAYQFAAETLITLFARHFEADVRVEKLASKLNRPVVANEDAVNVLAMPTGMLYGLSVQQDLWFLADRAAIHDQRKQQRESSCSETTWTATNTAPDAAHSPSETVTWYGSSDFNAGTFEGAFHDIAAGAGDFVDATSSGDFVDASTDTGGFGTDGSAGGDSGGGDGGGCGGGCGGD